MGYLEEDGMSSYPYLWAAEHASNAIDALHALDRDLSEVFSMDEDECPCDLADLWAASQRAVGRLRRLLEEMRPRIEADRTRLQEDDR